MFFKYSLFVCFYLFVVFVNCQIDLRDVFSSCRQGIAFDDCIKNGINSLTPYFKTGLPDYNIRPLDPFFAMEVPQKRSNRFFNYKLLLRNVTESGWTLSQITKFKYNPQSYSVVYTQFFPDKRLKGWYEIDGTILGNKITNKGAWNLSLYDFVQTTTITRKPIKDLNGNWVQNPPLRVKVNIQKCKNLELHIEHLAGGRTLIENMLDWIINTAWQPGFLILTPLINDLVSTAFTEIFNTDFRNFPFEQIFQN